MGEVPDCWAILPNILIYATLNKKIKNTMKKPTNTRPNNKSIFEQQKDFRQQALKLASENKDKKPTKFLLK